MKKKENLSTPHVGLKVAGEDVVLGAEPQIYSVDAIFKFAQDLAVFEKARPVLEVSPEISSLDNIQASTKKSAIRLKANPNKGVSDNTSQDNVESISSNRHWTKPPTSGRKGP
jgi:hypothetical protein